MTARQQPLIAIDVVPIAYDATMLGVLLGTAERQFAPFRGARALPGVLLGGEESLARAAGRALRDKARIRSGQVRHLVQIGAFDGPERDPRDRAISVAFLAVVEPDPSPQTVWAPWGQELSLPFDHGRIIAAARDVARTRIWTDQEFTRALTGRRFSTTDASAITARLTGVTPRPSNLPRMLAGIDGLAAVGKGGSTAAGGRPATIWEWHRDLRGAPTGA